MKKYLDCLLVGNKEYPLNERILMAGGNIAALNYCQHEYVKYKGKMWFYDEFYTQLSKEKQGETYKISEMPYLGIMYLDNYMRNRGLRIKSFYNFDLEYENLLKCVEKHDIKIIALSAVFYTSAIPLLKLVKFFRKHCPESEIIVGGAYIYNEFYTVAKEKLEDELKFIGADYYICDAQGEQALYNIVNERRLGHEVSKVKNVVELKDECVLYHEEEKEHNEMNENLIDYNNVQENFRFSTLNIRTARGCPNRCAFCNYPVRNPKLELESNENIERQILGLNRNDYVKNFVFIDDSFNMPLRRFKEICRMMIRNKNKKDWFSYFRMSSCDEEAVSLMKESGCRGVFLGVESANDDVLENMNKRTTVAQYDAALKLFRKYGIATFAYFMIGFPGETKETIKRNVEFLNENKIDFYSFNLWFVESNTPIYKRKEEFGLTGDGFNWSHNTTNSTEASEYMNYMYDNVTESTYIPGENFSFWGVPYMMGKGIGFQEVKNILNYTRQYIKSGGDKEIQEDNIVKIKELLR